MEKFEEIDVQKAKELIGHEDMVIVDVRSGEAFEEGHIENALNINDSNIDEFVKGSDKTKPMLCYCHMGFSSQGAAQYFKDQGFETVYSMKGGFTDWQKAHDAS